MKHFEDIKKLNDFYQVGVKHPLIDIRRYEDAHGKKLLKQEPISFDFYVILFVKNFNGFIEVGNTRFDGDNGILHFIEPKQIYTCNSTIPWEGFQILIHPDIFGEYFAHKNINTYDFFTYEVNEALLLTEEEENLVSHLMEMAWNEFHERKDSFSMSIILSYISTLLNLAERFYARQFENRKKLGNHLSEKFYELLRNYYLERKDDEVQQPTVQFFANKLNVTPNYLSDTLRHQSGQSALSIIHDFIIEEAKRQLTTTHHTVSEISDHLGFEYPNYFSKLFKRKTKLSPSEYRKSVKSI
ncbi:MAG TPA: AraC family transcriptional regulator [Saprospiraceae bacterium]|nr:AraC family transcriptional regulator [Saprospiraceae bacterium]